MICGIKANVRGQRCAAFGASATGDDVMPKEWTPEDFDRYVTRLNLGTEQQEAALKALTINTLLKEFLDTSAGHIILDTMVEKIRNLVMNIVNLATDGAKKNTEEIIQSALLIKIISLFMQDMAKLYSDTNKKLEEVNDKE